MKTLRKEAVLAYFNTWSQKLNIGIKYSILVHVYKNRVSINFSVLLSSIIIFEQKFHKEYFVTSETPVIIQSALRFNEGSG